MPTKQIELGRVWCLLTQAAKAYVMIKLTFTRPYRSIDRFQGILEYQHEKKQRKYWRLTTEKLIALLHSTTLYVL